MKEGVFKHSEEILYEIYDSRRAVVLVADGGEN